jgi:hypothetical protein
MLCKGQQREINRVTPKTRVVAPDLFNTDPDPAFLLNPDPDPDPVPDPVPDPDPS